jgi:hypothetical protein
MAKAGVNKPKGKRGNDRGDLFIEKGLDQLTEELVDVAEEIDLISKEGSTLEDIEGCKLLAATVLNKYSTLHERLAGRNRTQLEQSIGPAVERVRRGLTLLKEAPE